MDVIDFSAQSNYIKIRTKKVTYLSPIKQMIENYDIAICLTIYVDETPVY